MNDFVCAHLSLLLLFSLQFRRFETELGDEFGDDIKVVSDIILSTILRIKRVCKPCVCGSNQIPCLGVSIVVKMHCCLTQNYTSK